MGLKAENRTGLDMTSWTGIFRRVGTVYALGFGF